MEIIVLPTARSCNPAVNVRIEIAAEVEGRARILHCSP